MSSPRSIVNRTSSKECELSAELEAVDRQLQLEVLKLKKERIARGEQDEDDTDVDSGDLERRMSINLDDEKKLKQVEKSQLKDMMGWEKDALVDQDSTSIDMRAAGAPVHTVNGSTVADGSVRANTHLNALTDADGSEYNPRSVGRRSSIGDLTEIVWRRECLIERDDEQKGSEKDVEKPNSPEQGERLSSTRHPSLDGVRPSQSAGSSGLKRSHSHHQHRKSVGARRSFSAMRDFVVGPLRENPNSKPSIYAPLTTEALLRRRLIDTYMQMSELKSYVALNYLGFRKIVKKHDKLARCTTLERYMTTVVDLSAPFQAESRQQLDTQILRLQSIYARTCTNGSMSQAAKELRSHLREYIVWERNTVWRDMVGQERKAEGARAVDPKENEPWVVFGYPIRFITAAGARRVLLGVLGIIIFAVLMSVSIFNTQEQNRCFAILITVAYFWATEVFPLFATALLVPLLTVLCQVMRDPTTKVTLSTSAATKLVFSSMFSPTIMLLLGGFTIASALSKFGIAKAIASTVLSKAGTDPKWVLLANMLVATIASMFISNVAAP
ncbi:low-affinity phosphate transporter, partial [Lunasporangiospora selenospora]